VNGYAAYAASGARSTVPGQTPLVTEHATLVKRIAYHLASRLPPSVQVDDLIQSGMIGLLEAAKHYNPAQGASFETYAGIRIRGAMLDEIRRSDWTPRSVHRKVRAAAAAVHQIEKANGRAARDGEVAEFLGMGLDEYHSVLQDALTCRVFSYDDPEVLGDEDIASVAAHHEATPLDVLHSEAFRKSLARAIEDLPEREQMIMALYYDEELNLREIGEVLGVSESRVCQLHGQALVRLRARMAEWSSVAE
jgi:RNA polymerase sigma factor for flagellar operon FliA